MTVHEYILKNWETTIRDPQKPEDAALALVKLPNKYTTPCADDTFKNFYYWDTYFTNIGLLEDGMIDMARNNLNIMKYFVERLSFIPNADHLIYGSQPPFFARGIYELYQKTGDINDIKNYIYAAAAEMEFWHFDRSTPCGLNQYKSGWPIAKCDATYGYVENRVGGLTEEEKKLDKILLVQNFFAIAESGWDINLRYRRNGFRFDSLSFANLDLNSILYDAEARIAEMAEIIGEDELAKKFHEKSENRKALMNKFMLDKETGIYYDYCFVDDKKSNFLCAAAFYPYAFGLSTDPKGAKEAFRRLDQQYGLSTAEFRGEDQYLQWDYPHMWPPVVYLAYIGLRNVGLNDEATLLKKQYIETVDRNFAANGHLWEKYDTVNGDVSITVEYTTPTMMGWTAGVYEYFLNN